ncbi:hypothetical protein LCGC14_1215030 [marine sediment metagenome]|uniref:Uncharacterized protein n=1 Tax=marine sediment metagenome TaxID=412755 RepID=A0A0F9PHN6_9ZZZZ
MRRTNGHTSAPADEWVEAGPCNWADYPAKFRDWTGGDLPRPTPFAELPAAEAVTYILGAVSLLVLAAMIWTHYAERGK